MIGGAYSEVMTTRHSQSCTRSRKDSAEKPAKTVEWTAPILAHARKAAAACLLSSTTRLIGSGTQPSKCKNHYSPSHRQVNTDRIPLLHAPILQHVRDPTRLPQEFRIRDHARVVSLVGFEEDGRLVGVGVGVAVETVVRNVKTAFGAVISWERSGSSFRGGHSGMGAYNHWTSPCSKPPARTVLNGRCQKSSCSAVYINHRMITIISFSFTISDAAQNAKQTFLHHSSLPSPTVFFHSSL